MFGILWGEAMSIQTIKIQTSGYIHCKSCFYATCDMLNDFNTYEFSKGINQLEGEIDSGVWAISYLISMYPYDTKNCVIFPPTTIQMNGTDCPLSQLCKYSCYMDPVHPLFSSKKTMHRLISKGIAHNQNIESVEMIREMFCIGRERFERPLSGVGNERFRCMAAIGYVYDKDIFCFPWLSRMRFDYYHRNLTDVLQILKDRQKTILLPIGKG